MAAIAFFLVIALLHYASAQNITTQIMLPDALFYEQQGDNQTFVGEVRTSGISTYYTINCDYNNSNFYPGPVACLPSDSYTFSANSVNTKYLLPDINLGTDPISNTGPIATWLQTFNQTVTVNCKPGTSTNDGSGSSYYYAPCVTTSLYNDEDADDKSIISSTIVAQSSITNESVWYTAIFTNPSAAAIASPTAPSPTAAATTRTTIPSPAATTTLRAATGILPTTASSHPISNQTSHSSSRLSTGAKAGIGIGVPLGVFAFAAMLFFLCRRLRAQVNRTQMETLALRPDKGSPVEPQREYKDDMPPPDNSGVYEMEQREEPVRTGELEA